MGTCFHMVINACRVGPSIINLLTIVAIIQLYNDSLNSHHQELSFSDHYYEYKLIRA